MSKQLTYGELAARLEAIGYKETRLPRSHVVFQRGDEWDSMIVLPIRPRRGPVQPNHLVAVRATLRDTGVLRPDRIENFFRTSDNGLRMGTAAAKSTSRKRRNGAVSTPPARRSS
jgi:hypothetical protein